MGGLIDKIENGLLEILPTAMLLTISGLCLNYSLIVAARGERFESVYMGALSLISAFGAGKIYKR